MVKEIYFQPIKTIKKINKVKNSSFIFFKKNKINQFFLLMKKLTKKILSFQ